MQTKVLIVIPARGGSKGIPRKNLRSLAGKPLIYHSINTALQSRYRPDVYVSMDDHEIGQIARQIGAGVVMREPEFARDQTTLDPVIYHAYRHLRDLKSSDYDVVVTLQPTSPLLKTCTLDSAIDRLLSQPDLDTIISARDATHLTWVKRDGQFHPNYQERVNRQYLAPLYKETGGFLISRASCIRENSRIGERVDLFLLNNGEDIDIDTYEDWSLCEYYFRHRHVLFVVAGYTEIGLGHVYNTLLIANDILDHRIEFLVDKKSQLAFDKIASKHYQVRMQKYPDIVSDILEIGPNLVINDRLDTDRDYVKSLKDRGIKVVNFEDLGEGAMCADLVINALYPEKEILPNHYFGHRYFVLRDEFLLQSGTRRATSKLERVLITFGGVDPNNYTCKVLSAIYDDCRERGIQLSVIAGFGYSNFDSLERFCGIEIHRNSPSIAEHMRLADLVFTSAGRTTYEVASLQTPAIVLAQNQRELTHFFSSQENGFLNMGLGYEVSAAQIRSAFLKLADNPLALQHMQVLMGKTDLTQGRKRTIKLIYDILEDA